MADVALVAKLTQDLKSRTRAFPNPPISNGQSPSDVIRK
jgi:hypothetical protein